MNTTFLLPSLQADFRNQLKSECRRRSTALNTTIFGTAFSPSSSSSSSEGSYLVGVSSSGHILIWDLQQRDSSGSGNERTCIGDGPGKKRKIMEDNVNRNSPCFQFKVCDGALYDVQFISNSDDTGNGSLLVACGENGIFLYAFEDIISSMKKGLTSSSLLPPKCKSYMTLTPNLPSTGSAFTPEFNRISYDKSSGNLYGAAGDGRGYIWDINTSQLVGSLSSSGKSNTNAARSRSSSGSRSRRSHLNSDYLHTIKVIDADSNAPCHGCVLTGGEGNFSMWSGKDQKLIDTFDCRAMGVDAGTSSSSSSSSSSHGATAAAIGKKQCWVSSIAVDTVGNWCMIGGGRKGSSSSTASTSASTSATRDGGYLQLFSIQNRTMMNSSSSFMYRETPEIIHDIAYDASGSNILSVGDNGIVSSWESMNLGKGRTGKAWGSSPASYSVSVHPEDGMVVTGNVRSSVDCFTEYLAKTCTLTVA